MKATKQKHLYNISSSFFVSVIFSDAAIVCCLYSILLMFAVGFCSAVHHQSLTSAICSREAGTIFQSQPNGPMGEAHLRTMHYFLLWDSTSSLAKNPLCLGLFLLSMKIYKGTAECTASPNPFPDAFWVLLKCSRTKCPITSKESRT